MAPVSDRDGRREGALSVEDCRCPVCLEIFMEPVTLPCTHTFCKDCFLESVDKATLCCPLCRKRVSTWARMNSKNNTLVNQPLWTQIQTCFPVQCQRRLSGQDVITDDDPEVSVCFPRVCEQGELRQEYEDQVTKLAEEKRALDEVERRASEEYIQRLLAEEEELLQQERKRREDDERLARLLSSQLNSAAVSQENLRAVDVTPAKKKEVSVGQIDKFLCPRPPKISSSGCSSTSSFVANKENILLSQMMLQAECLPPQLDYYGPLTNCDGSDPPKLHPASPAASVEDQLHPESHRGHPTRDGPPSAKRKSSELETTEDKELTDIKRLCHSSSSLQVGVAEWESELLSRQQQEEEDRRLALLLQKELDEEEKQRATDRRKGSSDAYLLRHNSKGHDEACTSYTPSRPSRKTPKTSSSSSSSSGKTTKTSSSSSSSSSSSGKTTKTSSSSSSGKTTKNSTSSSRGSKQATLTEMFSSLSS